MKKEIKKRYLAYARENDGDKERVSVDKQIMECYKQVDSIGGEVIKIITDRNFSDSEDNRSGFQEILNYYNYYPDRFDGVVVYELSRLTTSLEEFTSLLNMSTHDGKGIISVKEKLDTGSMAGRLLMSMMATCIDYVETVSKTEGR